MRFYHKIWYIKPNRIYCDQIRIEKLNTLKDISRKIRSVLFMPLKWSFILFLVILFMISCYVFYPKIENFFIFFPQSSFDLSPDDLRLNHKDVYFDSMDGKRLHGWFFPLNGEYPVILFFHGNAGNISHRLDNVKLLLERQLQVFIFDYRGYGESSGSPSETVYRS